MNYKEQKVSIVSPLSIVFLHRLFLENEAQINKRNGTMFYKSKQVPLPKISLILQEMKIGPKSDIP